MAKLTKRGRDAKTYRNTGTVGSPTWNLVDRIRAENLDSMWETADGHDRSSEEKKHALIIKDRTLTFTQHWDPTDADCAAFDEAHEAGTALNLAVVDGAIATTGTVGLKADFVLTKKTMGRDQDQNQTVDWEGKIADTDTVATWFEVA